MILTRRLVIWFPTYYPLVDPLLASNNSRHLAGSFRPEDSTCLSWLDEQPIGSVIYVALGSTAILNQQQFDELAIDGFEERIAGRGKIVEWAPQEKVLLHSSVACFVSHCGWNSTLEGLSMGVPFLCWPFFIDQNQNRNYICEGWKIGLELTRDENGIVTRHEMQIKITKLLSDEGIKGNALKLKEKLSEMRKQPHVLVIPYPAQGHVPPLLKLATKIAENGIEVTFVNTDLIAAKVMAAMPEEPEGWSLIKFVSISDGIGQEEDRTDFDKTTNTMLRVMPGNLKDLIEKINQSSDNEQITCVIADILVVWAIELAQKMGIPRAAFVPYGPATLALSFHIKKLTEAGILDMNGNATSDGLISISEESLPWKANELAWSLPFNKKTQKVLFGALCAVDQIVKISNWVLSNSFYELDSSSCDLVPSILPIGPLLASNNSRHLAGSFRPEDSTCLSWLDKQPIGSVIYVALGSTGTLNQQQFDELAIGWKIGLELIRDENGIVTRHEIQTKVTKLLSDEGIKGKTLKLKDMARRSLIEGGSSFRNLGRFIVEMTSS
ncbi:hypothetical protein Patl1_18862 [Pistacia atlantica]|uniref:Uncharacterized protein n=1 Tax=Pistacia atlantica TaxID=434234 RepID=A0ACC1C0C0_9ROSI|nr:hypothetical protein Patl1_18862 [Pistacia atlantica]